MSRSVRDLIVATVEVAGALVAYYAMYPAEARAARMALLYSGMRASQTVAETAGRLALSLEVRYRQEML